VAPDSSVHVTFERPANHQSAEATFRIEPPWDGSFEWPSATEMIWRPASPLPYSMGFTVTAGGNATGGDAFVPRKWSFDTHDPPVFIEIQGSDAVPTTLRAVPSGGRGDYAILWSTGEMTATIEPTVPQGETRTYSVSVLSGDQTATATKDVHGLAWSGTYSQRGCPDGWEWTETSICTLTQDLPGPVRTYVARVDLRDPDVLLEVLPAASGLGDTAPIANRAGELGSIIAVNGSFMEARGDFEIPIGPVLSGGGYAALPPYGVPTFALDGGRNPHVGTGLDLRPSVSGPHGSATLQFVNNVPGEGGLSVFNGYAMGPTPAFDGCLAMVWPNGDDLVAGVNDVFCGQIGEIPVPPGGFTLVGQGGGAEWIRANVPGTLTFSGSAAWFAIGGSHVLRPYVESQPGFNVEGRHPRTAIGADDDGFLYLVVIDGRNENSAGMDIGELAGYLAGLGVTRAINLDGGGSSTFMRGGQVLNTPSDGKLRDVSTVISVTRYHQRPCSHPLRRC
jgi:hypothetical protein